MKNLPRGLLLLLPFPRILFPFPEIINIFVLMEPSQAELLQIVTVIKTLMAHLHCRRRTRIQIPNPMATLYYAGHVHIAQTQDCDPQSVFLYMAGI